MSSPAPQANSHPPQQVAPEPVSLGIWIARALVLVVFVPPRLLWEAITRIPGLIAAAARLVVNHLLKPVSILFRDWVYRPAVNFVRNYLWHLVIQQLLWGMVLTPLGAFLLSFLLRPLQHAVEDFLWRRVLKPGIPWVFDHLVMPVVRAVAWLVITIVKWVVVLPISTLWLRVLKPGVPWIWNRAVVPAGQGIVHLVSSAVNLLITQPLSMLWRRVVQPGGHWVRIRVVEPVTAWMLRWVLRPAARAAAWTGEALLATARFLVTWLLIWPARQFWLWVLRPLLYGLLITVVFGWKVATTVVGVVVIEPCRWFNRVALQPLFAAIARAWRALAGPVRWTYQKVIMPWRARASEVWTMVFR
ncbi:hypothetical protein [Nocardia sp. NBC_00511]|uniref:hypothetical protein n=1 Tax=Nocardia sp. NBC_00511 TaxID=2903591 RepID=UPI0030E433DF